MSDFLATAVEIARAAGGLLVPIFERGVRVEYKGEVDLVTEADRASERLIVERLRAHFPGHGIVAEEGGGQASDSPYCWYVDPVDGTTNFAHGFPFFCVSIGLERDGEGVVGVVYDPIRDELFTAEKGAGAWLNNRLIRVSSTAALSQSLLATGFPARRRHKNPNVHFYHQLNMVSHGVRRVGSAALDLCYVACGRMDAFWEFSLSPWDVAAGMLLVSEAGGRVTDMRGGTYRMSSDTMVVSNGVIHPALVQLFRGIFQGVSEVPLPTL